MIMDDTDWTGEHTHSHIIVAVSISTFTWQIAFFVQMHFTIMSRMRLCVLIIILISANICAAIKFNMDCSAQCSLLTPYSHLIKHSTRQSHTHARIERSFETINLTQNTNDAQWLGYAIMRDAIQNWLNGIPIVSPPAANDDLVFVQKYRWAIHSWNHKKHQNLCWNYVWNLYILIICTGYSTAVIRIPAVTRFIVNLVNFLIFRFWINLPNHYCHSIESFANERNSYLNRMESSWRNCSQSTTTWSNSKMWYLADWADLNGEWYAQFIASAA